MADTASPKNTKSTTGAAAPEIPSAFDLFKPSWEAVQLNIIEFFVIFLAPTAGLFLLGLIISVLIPSDARALGLIILFVVGVLIYIGVVGPALVHAQLQSARQKKVSYAEAFERSKKFWARFIALSIVVGLVIAIGFVLLIVPGVIFLRRYFLAQYAMLDKDLGIRDSMRASSKLSEGRSMAIFGIIGVDILIGLPNIIPVIGGFITFVLQIVYLCAPAIRYDQLQALKPVNDRASS